MCDLNLDKWQYLAKHRGGVTSKIKCESASLIFWGHTLSIYKNLTSDDLDSADKHGLFHVVALSWFTVSVVLSSPLTRNMEVNSWNNNSSHPGCHTPLCRPLDQVSGSLSPNQITLNYKHCSQQSNLEKLVKKHWRLKEWSQPKHQLILSLCGRPKLKKEVSL